MLFVRIQEMLGKLRKDLFLVNSLILFIGSFLVGVANYVYQILMARMLSVTEYGELQALLSILSIVTVLGGAVTIVVVKYAAEFFGKHEWDRVYSLLVVFLKKTFLLNLIFYVVYALCTPFLARFLNIPSLVPLLLLGISFFWSFAFAINSGMLRGLQRFTSLSVVSVLQAVLKILFSVLLVYFGFSVNGAVGALALSLFCTVVISLYPMKDLFAYKKISLPGKHMFQYSFPVFFTLLFTTFLWSMDILLVKHFFSAEVAGEYSALGLLGRIIFFLTAPIVAVMFPMAADAHIAQGFPAKVLKKAGLLIMVLGGGVVVLYFAIPEFIVSTLLGEKFLGMVPYLGWFGLSMLGASLISLISNYFLSIEQKKGAIFIGLSALLQIFLIVWFHETLWQVVWIMNGVMWFCTLLLIGYFIRIHYLCPKK